MRSGLATRVDRIAKRITPPSTRMPKVIFAEFDRDESEVVGLCMGDTYIPRHAGETLDQLHERACTETGLGLWAADYGDDDQCIDRFNQRHAEKPNADGLVE